MFIPPGTMSFAFTDAVNEAFEHLRVPLFYADMVKMNDRTASCMRETLTEMYTQDR